MSRLVRGLHTTCRRLEDITSEYLKISGGGGRSALAKHNRRKAKKVTPESLGFVPFDTSRSRVLPIVGTDDRFVPERKGGARQSTGNSARTSGGQSAKTESQQSSRPPAAASQSETESKVEAVSNEFFEGSDLAAPELRVPLASRFPRTQQRPDTRKCFNCQQPGHLASACPNPRVERPRGGATGYQGARGSGSGDKRRSLARGRSARTKSSSPRFSFDRSVPLIPDVDPSEVAQAIKTEAESKINPLGPHALFGAIPVLRPLAKGVQFKQGEWWAKNLSRPEARKAFALRLQGDYSKQVPANPLNGSKIDRANFIVGMNKTIAPSKRAEAAEVLSAYLN